MNKFSLFYIAIITILILSVVSIFFDYIAEVYKIGFAVVVNGKLEICSYAIIPESIMVVLLFLILSYFFVYFVPVPLYLRVLILTIFLLIMTVTFYEELYNNLGQYVWNNIARIITGV
jgi:hypothetical protein